MVTLRGVDKTFRSRQGSEYVALRDFDLELVRGEFFCLVGTSGCGKTTVLNLVAGFEAPTRGVIEFEGRAIGSPSRDRGVVFHGDDSLYEWLTALENVDFGLRMRGLGLRIPPSGFPRPSPVTHSPPQSSSPAPRPLP